MSIGHSVSKQSGVARYRQVAEDLLARMHRHELSPGERLAPEGQLARQYGVNRLTVRRALEELARAGRVRTEHGVGSFVTAPPVRHRIDDGAASLSESMAKRGLAVRHQVLAVTEIEEDGEGPFGDFPGATVEFSFVRFLEEEPWSVGEVLLPASLAPARWDGDCSLFAVLAAEHGLAITRGEIVFGAHPADSGEAAALQVPVGAALMEVSGSNIDERGRTVATFAHRIRGDRAEYAVRVAR
jgi:DNA-binding GntR family transcriptional regulator